MTSGRAVAVPRGVLYSTLRQAFAYPDAALYDSLARREWQSRLAAACQTLPFEAPATADLDAVPADLEAAQVEYSRLFDVGPGGPPCSLFGGHYESDRMRAMEEAVRFYEFFGLRFDREVGIFPDYLPVEMEFMQYLAERSQGPDASSYLRAQRDFLERHLARWTPQLAGAVARQAELPFYRALVDFTVSVVEADRRYLLGIVRQLPD